MIRKRPKSSQKTYINHTLVKNTATMQPLQQCSHEQPPFGGWPLGQLCPHQDSWSRNSREFLGASRHPHEWPPSQYLWYIRSLCGSTVGGVSCDWSPPVLSLCPRYYYMENFLYARRKYNKRVSEVHSLMPSDVIKMFINHYLYIGSNHKSTRGWIRHT